MARHGERETIIGRNETVTRLARNMIWVTLAMSTVSAIAVSASIWALSQKPEPRYFATRTDGGILPMVAVSTPFLTDNQVLNFSVDAITSAMTINFATWRDDLREASRYFERPNGWNSFIDAIESGGHIDFIQQRRFISSSIANGATIIRQGLDAQNRYSWTVQVPITVTYQSSSEQAEQDYLAELVISRIPTYESPDAVGVSRIVMRTGRPAQDDTL